MMMRFVLIQVSAASAGGIAQGASRREDFARRRLRFRNGGW